MHGSPMSICDDIFNGYSRDLSLATRAVDEMDEYITDTCVRGFHVYQIVWRPVIGEELPCERRRIRYGPLRCCNYEAER